MKEFSQLQQGTGRSVKDVSLNLLTKVVVQEYKSSLWRGTGFLASMYDKNLVKYDAASNSLYFLKERSRLLLTCISCDSASLHVELGKRKTWQNVRQCLSERLKTEEKRWGEREKKERRKQQQYDKKRFKTHAPVNKHKYNYRKIDKLVGR